MSLPSPRPTLTVCVLSCLFASCASSRETMVVNVSPPEASVYINGKREGQGGRRARDLDFGAQPRIYVQATAPGFEPHFEWFTRKEVRELMDRNLDLAITLRQRR